MDRDEKAGAIFSALGSGIKWSVIGFVISLLFFPDREGYPGGDPVFRPDKALWYALLAGAVVFVVLLMSKLGELAAEKQLDEKVSSLRGIRHAPIEAKYRVGRVVGEVYFEIAKVPRFEIRRTRAANFAMGTLSKSVGPVRVKVGQLAFNRPDVWREIDRGTVVVTSHALIYQGIKRRQEWRWSSVGDIVYDQNGLLVWPRNGRPIGLKTGPVPNLFAFIEDRLSEV